MIFKKGYFKPYGRARYTNKYFDRYIKERGSYAELCCRCGFPMGEHSGYDACPGENGFQYKPKMKPQFYCEELSKNTRTI